MRVPFARREKRTAAESLSIALDISGLARGRTLRIVGRVPAAFVVWC